MKFLRVEEFSQFALTDRVTRGVIKELGPAGTSFWVLSGRSILSLAHLQN